jgi:hypothetical protein
MENAWRTLVAQHDAAYLVWGDLRQLPRSQFILSSLESPPILIDGAGSVVTPSAG